MAQVDLTVVLKLLDEASSQIKEAMGGVKDETDKVKKKSDEASKSLKNGFRESTQAIRTFRRDVAIAVSIMTALYVSVKEYARYNDEARESVHDLEKSMTSLKVTAGGVITELSKSWKENFWKNALIPGHAIFDFFIKIKDGGAKSISEALGNKTDIENATNAIKDLKTALSDIDMLYRAGKISSEEYANKLQESNFAETSMNEQKMAQMQEIDLLRTQINNNEFMEAARLNEEKIALLNEYRENYMIAHQGMAAFTVMLSSSIRTNLSGAITAMATGAKSAKEAFAELGTSMLQAIVDFMAQKVIAWVLEKTLLAATVTASAAAGAAVAAAWAPAAAMVSLATMGGNAAPAAAGITAINALTAGYATAGNARALINVLSTAEGGGRLLDAGSTVSDVIPRAHGGDDIVTRPTLFLAGENGPERARFTPLGDGGDSGEGININIFYPRFNSKEEIDEIMRNMGTHIRQQSRYARSM